MKITWLGTASFVFETEHARVLFDPFVQLIGGAHPNTIDDFLHEDVIFITHGHFDHLFYVPDILEQSEATVYCSGVPARMLESLTERVDQIAEFTVGQEIPVGDMRITSCPSEHIRFERRYLKDYVSAKRLLAYGRNLPFLLYANRSFQEGNETLAYRIEAEGKTILLLGSLNLDYSFDGYPDRPDVLVLPYQGSNDLVREADLVLERIRPRAVLLSHFDDAFPPISRNVDLSGLKDLLLEKYPDVKVVKPVYGKTMKL